MSSRRSVRQLLVAVLLGVLVGGGLMAVTPAGAEVSNAVATNWKKIWKKNLKPLADKRYYTKAQSDAKYSTKAETAAGDAATNSKFSGYYTKAEADAKYSAAGSGYTKAESDNAFVAKSGLKRGTWAVGSTAAAANAFSIDNISYGVTLTAAPTPHYIAFGDPAPAGCAGTVNAPDASPGHLCVFEGSVLNMSNVGIFNVNAGTGSSTMGAWVRGLSAAAGVNYAGGSWAMRPGTPALGRPAPQRDVQLVP